MSTLGSNLGYVDELYAKYLADPSSVSEAWREFFADYVPPGAPVAEHGGGSAASASAPRRKSSEEVALPDGAQPVPIRGVALRIVENMTQSLSIPTATSARSVPVKLLDENRRLINQHQTAIHSFKVSFSHLIAWAIVRAIEKHPNLNSGFGEYEEEYHRIQRPRINLGLAIDIERKGERILLVAGLKNAGALDFPSFTIAYDDLVARARQGKLAVEDFRDITVTMTNPGMIGTSMSVPRLMSGQGAIVGVGAIGYPAEYSGMAPEVISQLGISKVMTVTSTYDHRIIQGAESGAFLATIEKLLTGEEGFYDRVFTELGISHEPVRWSGDQNPAVLDAPAGNPSIEKQIRVIQLIRSYRIRGHLLADLDPLAYEPKPHPELELSRYGLTLWDLDRKFLHGDIAGQSGTMPLREILDILRETYCRKIGVEYMHIPEVEIRRWLSDRMERTRNGEPLTAADRTWILSKLNAAEAFEKFLHGAYVGHKRFSLEGAETLIPMLGDLLGRAAGAGVEEVVMGMAHRGRLNVVANILGKSYSSMFRVFEGDIDPASTHGSGDVKYHLGAAGTYTSPDGRSVRVVLASNPSHLEAVDPVVEGMARARQDALGDTTRDRILPVLIHGDAAFAGQGMVAETLNLSQLKGYRTGGTVHIVVNNQIGFTTGPAEARSSLYSTDVAKMVRAPVFHVNSDSPEAAVRVIKLAFEYRQAFKRDVVVDLVCYRRWGHNEADDPSYTHPLLYAKIEKHRSVRKLYTEDLLRRGELDLAEAEKSLEDFRRHLTGAFDEVHRVHDRAEPEPPRLTVPPAEGPSDEGQADEGQADGPPVATGTPVEVLEEILAGMERLPEGFKLHPKLSKQIAQRRERFEGGRIDWALAEALSFGSLVLSGVPVRLSGEDSGRGTFSQRHGILYDYVTGKPWTPLSNLRKDQAPFTIFDSLLSELAVVGFEYGYSVNYPQALVLWEAQFGDFANGAQVIIDQFIASAEEKWGQTSGLVMLLPHGYEGQGPDHSSTRLERFLQLAARDNMIVASPSTPAQYFHLLRRQVLGGKQKPLVVLTPKSLLRHPEAVSSSTALAEGSFEVALDDPRATAAEDVRRVVIHSGKIHYELDALRREAGAASTALVRIEQLYPFPARQLASILARHGGAEEVIWAQEEPRNMGAWTFVSERLRELLEPGQTLAYVGRPPSPSPATGSHRIHQAEQRAILEEALGLRGAGSRPRSLEAVETDPRPGAH